MRKLLLFIIFVFESNGQCNYLDYIYKIDDALNFLNYSVNTTLHKSILKGQVNVGFGMWIKYEPYKIYPHTMFQPKPPRNYFQEDEVIDRKEEKFIFSMISQSHNNTLILMSFNYNENSKLFQYNIYTNFLSNSHFITHIINPADVEGIWFMFYLQFDLINQNTNVGFYNQEQRNWQTYQINDSPQLTPNIQFHVGGASRIETFQNQFWTFQNFYGTLTTIFQTENYNLIENDIESCELNLKFIYPCFNQQTFILYESEHLNGEIYFTRNYPYVLTKSFLINGWVKLDPILESNRETVIIRISMNVNYNDDENFGDRLLYLKYFQNQIPELNGLIISAQTYDLPIKYKYKSQESDIISSFDEDYQKLLTTWHIIQFEQGTLNNNGFPMFTLYFPYLGSYSLYWNKKFKYFSQPSFSFNFGGDKYSKSYIKGYIQDFQLQEICESVQLPIFITCHITCETCDGPTSNSCLSCSQILNRVFEPSTRSCICPDNYGELFGFMCFDFMFFGIKAIGNIQQINQLLENQCIIGEIQIDNLCYQCPYYEQFISKTKMLCGDCYLNRKQFMQTMACTFDYIAHNQSQILAYKYHHRSEDEIEFFQANKYQKNFIKVSDSTFKDLYNNIESEQIQINNTFMKNCNQFQIFNNQSISCIQCVSGYYIKHNYCEKCGSFCKQCNQFGLCDYCLDPQLYYLTFDGKNCLPCIIKNCKYCIQYYFENEKIILSSNFNSQIKNQDYIQIFEGCALCEKNFFFNFQTHKCEEKCKNFQSESDIQNCQSKFLDCQYGIIDKFNHMNCIKSLHSTNSIIYQDCNQFNHCAECTTPKQLQQICIVCQIGYYKEFDENQCKSCPKECYSCFSQNLQNQDYWKYNLYGFYQQVSDINDLFPIQPDQQEIICLECKTGYVLFNHSCIEDCDSNCQICEIQNGKSICIHCLSKYRGQMRAKSIDNICMDCPNGCSACAERNLIEIEEYNPYFLISAQNIKDTRKCFQVFEKSINENNLYIDQENFIVIQCLNEQICMNEVSLNLDVYCSYLDYRQDSYWFSLNMIQLFKFRERGYEEISQNYLMKLSTQKVNIFVNLIQGSAASCEIENDYFIDTIIQSKVFTIKEVNLYLVGSLPNTHLSFKGQFKINNFRTVTFRNLSIDFLDSGISQNKFFQIFINSKDKFLELAFEDCKFIGKNSDEQNLNVVTISFIINIPYFLKITNLSFIEFVIHNSNLFSANLINNQTLYFNFQNLLIQQSYFYNSTLLQLKDINFGSKLYDIDFSQVKIIDSIFESTTLIQVNNIDSKPNSKMNLNQISIEGTQFINSIIFYQSSIIKFNIDQLQIIKSKFIEKTSFIFSQYFNANDIFLSTVQIFNSNFIFNQLQNISKQENKEIQNLDIKFTKIQFIDIIFDNVQSFILIIKIYKNVNFSLKIDEIILQNIRSFDQTLSNSDMQQYKNNNQINSAFIYIESDICSIRNLNSERNFGVLEITLINSILIDLQDIQIKQSDSTNLKILNVNFFSKFEEILPYASFLIVSFYKQIIIDNLSIMNVSSLNHPIIQFSNHNIEFKILDELIEIKNSYFDKNLLILEDFTKGISIIDIKSIKQTHITISNVTFIGNILNNLVQNKDLASSSTLMINTQQGSIIIQNSTFICNLAINSTNSNLFLSSFQIILENIKFISNNHLINTLIYNKLLIESHSTSSLEKEFPILSKGGSAYFIQNKLFGYNISINQSISSEGGSFYIQTNGDGIILLENSIFTETMTLFTQQSNSKGGCIYIDSSQSSLNFKIFNSSFNISYSKNQGGSLYIVPSKLINLITLIHIDVYDSFSTQYSFLSLVFPDVQQTLSLVLMENIKFYQSKQGFEKFLSKVSDFGNKQQLHSMIYINFGNITIKSISFLQTFIQFLLHIINGDKILLDDVQIDNCTYFNQPLIFISLNENQYNQIILNRVNIRNIFFFKENTNKDCLITQNDTEKEYNQLICNQQIIFSNSKNINSLVQLVLQGQNQRLFIENSNFDTLLCKICEQGIIDIKVNIFGNIFIKSLIITNNICGNHGCLFIESINTTITNLRRLSQLQTLTTFEYEKVKTNNQLIIENSQFTNNSANLGGALFINNLSSLIYDSIFYLNRASLGGSIYYTATLMQLKFLKTKIIQNVAQQGGGLFLKQLVLDQIHPFYIYIDDNNAKQANLDISENPTSLTVSLNEGMTLLQKKLFLIQANYLIDQIVIKPYQTLGFQQYTEYIMLPSGIEINKYQYFDEIKLNHIPLNLTFRIIALNQFNERENQLQNSYCIIQNVVLSKLTNEQVNHIESSISLQNISFNITSQDYNLDNLIINFNPKYNQDYFLRLQIECNMIFIPIIDENNLSLNYKKYQLYVDIQTYQCQIGEYLNLQTGGCILCDPEQNLYSLTKDSTNCTYRDNNLIDEFTSSTIKLRQFYWRAQNNSTLIEYCYHLQQNCEGGWIPGDNSCSLGHIGALCEQCDLYNLRGQGSYSISSQYSCGSCDKIIGNSIIIIIIIIWVLVSIYLSVNSTVQNIEQMILSIRLKFLGFTNSSQKTSTAILVKLFNNYLQIISIIQSLELKIPSILVGIYSGIGNPISQMQYSWDCFIINISSIDINYFRIIWNIILAFIFINLFILSEFLKKIFYKVTFKITHITTALLYLITYMHPSIVASLISQLSYREISNIKWIQGNVAYLYETKQHKLWLISFIMPLLLIFAIFLPLFLLERIYQNRNQLDKIQVKKSWGYLINEYKKDAYFWDIVKIIQRQVIIIIFTYYQDYIPVKASLVVIILFFYSLLQAVFLPYKTKKMNQIESRTMKVCSISIILGSCIYQAQQLNIIEIVWLFYIIITSLNIQLFCYFIFLILKAYFQQFQKLLENLQDYASKFCPKFILRHPLFQRVLIKKAKQKCRIQYYIKKIREVILPQAKQYLNYKSNLQFNTSTTPQLEFFHQFTPNEEKMIHEPKIKQLLIRSSQQIREVQSLKF